MNEEPRAETRRIIALIGTAAGIGVLSYLALKGVEEALIALVSVVSSIIAFYFGQRARQG